MKHNASTLGRRAAAAAGVLTLAFLGLAPSAVATETPNYGNIKTEVKGSLAIHKHLTGGGKDIGTPTGTAQNADDKGPAVEGVVFTAYPITDINLKDPAGWDTISNLARTGVPDSACTNPAAPTLGAHTALRHSGHRHHALTAAIGLVIGVYDGAVGPGGSENSRRINGRLRILRLWLGRQDSNLGMAVPKTAALPLGDAPSGRPCAGNRG